MCVVRRKGGMVVDSLGLLFSHLQVKEESDLSISVQNLQTEVCHSPMIVTGCHSRLFHPEPPAGVATQPHQDHGEQQGKCVPQRKQFSGRIVAIGH